MVLNQEQIKKTEVTQASQLLSTQANIVVIGTNTQPSSIYLRGGDSSNILFLIDGIPSYDSSTPARTFNLNNLNYISINI